IAHARVRQPFAAPAHPRVVGPVRTEIPRLVLGPDRVPRDGALLRPALGIAEPKRRERRVEVEHTATADDHRVELGGPATVVAGGDSSDRCAEAALRVPAVAPERMWECGCEDLVLGIR